MIEEMVIKLVDGREIALEDLDDITIEESRFDNEVKITIEGTGLRVEEKRMEFADFLKKMFDFLNEDEEEVSLDELVSLVEDWAIDKDLDEADSKGQYMKIIEELGEVAQALTRDQPENLKMELGDVLVTVIVFALQVEVDLAEALELALDKISSRKGKTIDGIFIKEEDL